MVELETRELEYFVAVAEELHFGRAAVRLSIAQPALSKAVRRVESRLGVELLIRSSRHVALTPAGEALLHHGRLALDAVGAAATSARRAGDPQAQLRLVIKPGGDANLLSGILAAYAHQPDARRVEVLFGGATDRADHVRDGRADVALLYAPFDDLTGLEHRTLLVEERVAVLPRGHRLAGRAELTLADLAGERLPRWKGMSAGGTGGSAGPAGAGRAGSAGSGRASAVPGEPAVSDRASGPEIDDVAQLNHLILLGRAVAVLPRSVVQPYHPDLVYPPVADAPPSRVVVAWSRHDHRPLVASFVAAAVAASPRRPGGDANRDG
jgi:DNA-binding transcriptional LysR family regulator